MASDGLGLYVCKQDGLGRDEIGNTLTALEELGVTVSLREPGDPAPRGEESDGAESMDPTSIDDVLEGMSKKRERRVSIDLSSDGPDLSLDLWSPTFSIGENCIYVFTVANLLRYRMDADEKVPEEIVDISADVVRLATKLHLAVDATHTVSFSKPTPRYVVNQEEATDGEIDFLCSAVGWLSIFDQTQVAALGRAQLFDAPAWRVEELDDGSVLVRLTETFLPPGMGTMTERYEEARDYLHP